MSRNICVFQNFMTEEYEGMIRAAADKAGFGVRFFTEAQFDEALAFLPECEILYAQAPKLLRAAPASLKWYCASSAGVDVYCKNDGIFANPDCLLSNSNAYGVTISEYTVMVTLMLLRRWPHFAEPIRNHVWEPPVPVRSIKDSEITILGAGDIGNHVAERMRALGAAKIVGITRSGKSSAPQLYDEFYPISKLDELLPKAQILILALPGTAETIGILSRERIALLRKDALVINVGRGTAIDQDALVEALNEERIAGAGLDVVNPEPLPADDPLWSAKNLVITPHISGNLTLGHTCRTNVAMFCEDIANYAAGRPLVHLVDRTRGY